MNSYVSFFRNAGSLLLIVLLLTGTLSAQTDAEGSRDPEGLSRMNGFYIDVYEVDENGVYLFDLSTTESRNIEGRKTYWEYHLKSGSPRPTKTEIFKWYFAQAEKLEGAVPFEDLNDNIATLLYTIGGKERFCAVNIWDDGGVIALTVVEP